MDDFRQIINIIAEKQAEIASESLFTDEDEIRNQAQTQLLTSLRNTFTTTYLQDQSSDYNRGLEEGEARGLERAADYYDFDPLPNFAQLMRDEAAKVRNP